MNSLRPLVGHTLDVVIENVNSFRVLDLISDHNFIACNLDIAKPPPPVKTVNTRKYRSIDMFALKDDIISELSTNLSDNVCDLVDNYNHVMFEIIDKHAPIITKKMVLRPKQPWFTNSLKRAKCNRRKAERNWISSGSLRDFDQFRRARNRYNIELYNSKCSFLNPEIVDCGNDFKSMFRTINGILQKAKPTKLPDHDSATALADQFATYFATKIQHIRDNLVSQTSASIMLSPIPHSWNTFSPVNERDLRMIISKAPCPSCALDPIPSWIIKLVLDSVISTITAVVNRSLESGTVPDSLSCNAAPQKGKYGS
ncbi:hypothetical protein HOLleu_06422 [Holothuria leucospilota]|uniref:Uncharacterized protein n=1 Tax=Holothuria leucospilota TaxID=206669 RepID=A0A9Q1HI19_HOLLE|nr:hypothetical protein HOLleu_06422 [Holothuria leucospilota]